MDRAARRRGLDQTASRRQQDGEGEAPKPAWPTVVEAERLFHDLANAIRDKGMPPIGQEQGAGSSR